MNPSISFVSFGESENTLSKEYLALALRKTIPDVQEYRREWICLARRARCQGRRALMAMCVARANFYGEQPAGSYVREFPNAHTCELIPTDEAL